MRKLFLLFLCGMALQALAEDQLRLVRKGRLIEQHPGAAFKTNVVELLQSASVNSTSYAVTNNAWEKMLQSHSYVHLSFAAPTRLKVMLTPGNGQRSREELGVEQILIPLPEGDWPAHLYARAGTNTFSFTKYDPFSLKRVSLEPVLGLASVSPYKDLMRLDDPVK